MAETRAPVTPQSAAGLGSSGPVSWAELGLLALLLAVAVTLRLELLTARTFWHDESFSLAVARKPAWYIWKHLAAVDPHPPGYYLVLRTALQVFGDSLATARALSAGLGVLAVVLTWWVTRRLFDTGTALGAAALVALNPFQVYASNEVRMYPLVTCLVLLSTAALWNAWKSNRLGAWVAYGATQAALGYTSYYGVAASVGQWAWLVATGRRSGLAVALAVAAVLYSPWLPRVPWGGVPIVPHREFFRPAYLAELFATQAYGGYLFRTTTYLAWGGFDPGQHLLLVVPFAILSLAGAVALHRAHAPAAALVVVTWLAGFGLWTAASLVAGHLAAYPRHLVFLQPLLAILLAAGIVHLQDVVGRARRGIVVGAAAILVLSFLAPAVGNLQGNPEYQSFRYDQAARFVRALYRQGDALVFYQGGAQRVFQEYFTSGGVEVAVDPEFDRWSREGMRPILEAAARRLQRVRGRVWLVIVWPYPPDSPLDLIEAVERLGYRRAIRKDFRGVEVVLLARSRGDRQ